jgi:hypothetical protein
MPYGKREVVNDNDETILGNVWCGLQERDIVVVELTGSNSNVMIEFGWAYLLGKKLIPLTQCRKDMPSDLPGLRYIHYSPLMKEMRRMEEELARQLKVLAEKGSERRLVPLETSTIRPAAAKVVSTAREYAVVEAEKGQRCLLAPEERPMNGRARAGIRPVLFGLARSVNAGNRYVVEVA